MKFDKVVIGFTTVFIMVGLSFFCGFYGPTKSE